MTRPSPTGRWWPLLALPVLCCVGHVVLLAVGVGSVTALVGGAVGSAVAAAGVLLTTVAVAAMLRRRERPAATSSARPDLTQSTREGGAPTTPVLLVDLALAPLAGYLGTKVMEPIGTWLYERESQADRDLEEAVRRTGWRVLRRRP